MLNFLVIELCSDSKVLLPLLPIKASFIDIFLAFKFSLNKESIFKLSSLINDLTISLVDSFSKMINK